MRTITAMLFVFAMFVPAISFGQEEEYEDYPEIILYDHAAVLELEPQVNALEAKYDREVPEIKGRVDELEKKFEQKRIACEECRNAQQVAGQEEKKPCDCDLGPLRAEVASLKAEVAAYRDELDGMKKEIADIRKMMASVDGEIDPDTGEPVVTPDEEDLVTDVSRRVNALEGEMTAVSARVDDVEGDLADLREQLRGKQDRIRLETFGTGVFTLASEKPNRWYIMAGARLKIPIRSVRFLVGAALGFEESEDKLAGMVGIGVEKGDKFTWAIVANGYVRSGENALSERVLSGGLQVEYRLNPFVIGANAEAAWIKWTEADGRGSDLGGVFGVHIGTVFY